MNIQNIIVHLLEKEQYKADVNVQYRGTELEVSPQVETLLSHISKLYNQTSGRGYGEFEPGRFLEGELQSLIRGDVDFVAFSHHALGELASRVRTSTLASGGYVIVVRYEHNGETYVMFVMLKSTPGLTFDEELRIMGVNHLDLQRLHFAARVNVSAWQAEERRYISFIRGRATTAVTDYFKEFIGVTDYTDAAEKTRQLVNAVEDFCSMQGYDAEKTDRTKLRVHSYCLERHADGNPVYIEDLSRYLDEENPTEFLEYANSDAVALDDEIHIDRPALRPFIRYQGKDKDVSVSFTSNVYGRRVTYDPADNVLTIREVPVSLRAQLERRE